jgi:disulfide oxidoreductase YuzD
MSYVSTVLDRCARSEMAKACVALINSAKTKQEWLDGMLELEAKYPGIGFRREREVMVRMWKMDDVNPFEIASDVEDETPF